MRLSKRGYYSDHGESPLADKELPEDSSLSGMRDCSFGFDGREFILGIRGSDGDNTYWYALTLTPREVRVLLSKSLEDAYYQRDEEMPDAEKELWGTIFDLWEKRLKKLARKRS